MQNLSSFPHRFETQILDDVQTRLARLARRRLRGTARKAAVLVPLCEVDGTASVLFTRRSQKVGTHKGQVSFPGGMLDAEDPSAEAAALRELQEEIGFPAEQVRVLGSFHDARAITGVHVTPFVGYLGTVNVETLNLSEAEIDAVFTLKLTELIDPQHHHAQSYGERGQLPVFDAGPFPVWGLTAHILAGVLQEAFELELAKLR